jgi:hypothetical protein
LTDKPYPRFGVTYWALLEMLLGKEIERERERERERDEKEISGKAW